MPEIVALPDDQLIDFSIESIQTQEELARKEQALTLVNTTFNEYRDYRQNNTEPDWTKADALYFGLVQQKFWPNTQVPRASLPWKLTLEHVETAYAQIVESLFAEPQWFSVEADIPSTPEEARAVSDKLNYYLDHDREQFGTSAVTECTQSIKNLLMYGNGCLAIEWDMARRRPMWSFVDIRDLYWDPQAKHPNIDYSRGVIRRSLMTIEQIKRWKDLPGMDVPDDNTLYTLSYSSNNYNTQAYDNQDSIRGKQTVSNSQYTQYSPDLLVEVLSFWSTTKHIIVLGGKHVLLSTENPYNFIPFVVAPCYLVPGKLAGLSIPSVLEHNQLYIQSLVNSRLDEISLALNPPRVTKAGLPISPTQRGYHPGMNQQVGSPKEDVIMMTPSGVTNTALEEISMITQMSEKLDGVNSHLTGVPRGGNANRTATGMTQQLQGGQLKIMIVVRNIEDYMLTPALYKTVKMIQYYEEGENKEVFDKPCKFKIYGANRMLSREQIMQMAPFLMQYLLNGAFIERLTAQGQTVNFEEVFKMLSDGSRTGKTYSFIRPLTPQEQQQMSQPPPEVMMQAQQQDKELQAKMQIEQMKAQASNNPQLKQMELEAKMQEMQMDMVKSQQELEIEREMAKMKLQMEEMKLQFKQYETQMKLQATAQQAQLDSEIKQQEHAFGMQQQITDHAIQQQQSAEMHEAEKKRVEESNSRDLDYKEKEQDLKLKQMQLRPVSSGKKKEK
jgi:hypothetical protein